jgi:hypothetical protein
MEAGKINNEELSTIVLSHEINGLSREQINSIETNLGQKLTSSTIIRGSGIVIASSIPIVNGLPINSIRQLLIASTIVLLQRKFELDKILQLGFNYNIDEQSEVITSVEENNFGLSNLVTFIGNVADIASIISGGDRVTNDDE